MYEQLAELYPKGTCNHTDPIVRHDSPYEASVIATFFVPQEGDEERPTNNLPFDNTKMDGVHYPLIRINNHVLESEQIEKFVLYHDRFTPYLDLVFTDVYDVIHFSDMPGLDNSLTVIMLEDVNDIHKPIKLDFYVTKCKVHGKRFYVEAEFKLLSLEKKIFKQAKFFEGSQCDGEFCGLPENLHPTTYEFLHLIADECGLGFAATQKCRSIKDDRYRLLKSEKYKYAAQEHTRIGGLDEDSIFDSWIDPWGTLTMVNVPWVLNENVEPNELASQGIVGLPATDANLDIQKSTGWVHRILTNIQLNQTLHNFLYDGEIEKIVNLETGFYKGTNTEYQIVSIEGAAENEMTTFSAFEIREREATPQGKEFIDDYDFQEKKFIGFEMNELTPSLKQGAIHDEYFKQLRAHKFKLTLNQPNFGLERGCLVNVLKWVTSAEQKSIIVQNTQNVEDHNDELTEDIYNQEKPLLDVSLSGTYYIDGITWEYNSDTKSINQHLYLIKKGSVTQYYDRSQEPTLFNVTKNE